MAGKTEETTGIAATELRDLLGAPPVLRTEDAGAYQEIMDSLTAWLAPGDFMEQMLIRELADCTWEMARYTRHKHVLLEGGLREARESDAQGARAEESGDQAGERGGSTDGSAHGPDDFALKLELDCARALEANINYCERIVKLHLAMIAKRNDLLEEIERYRLGRCLQ
ncbi:MAG TPA: hypothetical protein VJ376_00375 [Pseudomonadota bacterium]|nr:hypothetical protein [Pseudomonadota bacterium]